MKLLALLAIAFAGLQGRADPEIHLIPSGYVGEVTIVFRAATGESLVREGDARLYRIPENGILLTQAEPNVGDSPAWELHSMPPSGERYPQSPASGRAPCTIRRRIVHTRPSRFFILVGAGSRRAACPCDVEYRSVCRRYESAIARSQSGRGSSPSRRVSAEDIRLPVSARPAADRPRPAPLARLRAAPDPPLQLFRISTMRCCPSCAMAPAFARLRTRTAAPVARSAAIRPA